MYPAAIIAVSLLRYIGKPPCISEVLHQLLVCHLLQKVCLFHSLYDAAGYQGGDEVHELASYEREVSFHSGLVQALIAFVPAEHHLELPSVRVAAVDGLGISLKIGLKDHYSASRHGLVVIINRELDRRIPQKLVKEEVLLTMGLAHVLECIQLPSTLYPLPAVGDAAVNAAEHALPREHAVRGYPRIIALEGCEEM